MVASVTGLIAFWDDAFQVTQWGSYMIYLAVAVLSGEFLCTCPLKQTANTEYSVPTVPRSSPHPSDSAGQPRIFCYRSHHYLLSGLGFEETVSAIFVSFDH